MAKYNEGDHISKTSTFNIDADYEANATSVEHSALTTAHTIGKDPWYQVGLMLVTAFNCAYILYYPGVLLVPVGWAWGLSAMFCIAIFVVYTNWVLSEFSIIGDRTFIRYRDIMNFVFGKSMYYITWILQFIQLVLVNTAFILAAGLSLKGINSEFSDSPIRLQYYIIIGGTVYFIFAVLVPTMSAIRSWLGISAALTLSYITILIVILFKDGSSETKRNYKIPGSHDDKMIFQILSAIACMISANTVGMQPEIQSTLRKPARSNMMKAQYMQFTLGLAFYYGITVLGYWAYGSATSGFLTNDLSGPKWAKVVINSLVFLQTVISQHTFIAPVYEAVDTKFFKLDQSLYSIDNILRRFALRAIFFMVNIFLAAIFPFAGDFLNLIGAVALVPLTFVFPSMIYIKVKGKTARSDQLVLHSAIIFFSSLFCVGATVSTFRSIIHNAKTYSAFADI